MVLVAGTASLMQALIGMCHGDIKHIRLVEPGDPKVRPQITPSGWLIRKGRVRSQAVNRVGECDNDHVMSVRGASSHRAIVQMRAITVTHTRGGAARKAALAVLAEAAIGDQRQSKQMSDRHAKLIVV